MQERLVLTLVVTGLFAGTTGCKKEVNHAEFLSAINKSFEGRHECIWPEPVKLPAKINPSTDDRIRVFQALADAGLLMRVAEDKKRFGSDQVNTYNLSDQGHASWTPEPNHPDSGNFCFGRFNATAIQKETPNNSTNPTQYTVNYQYEVLGIPHWVQTPESMRAFPKLAADTSIQSATATLSKAPDGSWTVNPPSSAQ